MAGKRDKRLDSSQCLTRTTRQKGTTCQFWVHLTFAGKKSLEVVIGVKHLMATFVIPRTELSGLTADSGSGTPESFANACTKIEIWGKRATEDPC
jgi:hypothetical protein